MTTNEMICFIETTGTEIFIGNNNKKYLSIYYKNFELFLELLQEDSDYFCEGDSIVAHINYNTISIELDSICSYYVIDLKKLIKYINRSLK